MAMVINDGKLKILFFILFCKDLPSTCVSPGRHTPYCNFWLNDDIIYTLSDFASLRI